MMTMRRLSKFICPAVCLYLSNPTAAFEICAHTGSEKIVAGVLHSQEPAACDKMTLKLYTLSRIVLMKK
jgi:hypothetical protein